MKIELSNDEILQIKTDFQRICIEHLKNRGIDIVQDSFELICHTFDFRFSLHEISAIIFEVAPPKQQNTLAVSLKNEEKCVHAEHCCAEHGCKYGDKDCPVWLGYKKQSFPYTDGIGTWAMPEISEEEFLRRRKARDV